MKKENTKNKEFLQKPSEYMRQRRPELFSDTKDTEESILEKGHVEYHLESLTSRKQEQLFEEFCRRLTELEVCPNLKPQTGPTGGGDSKADASTYPVSEELIEKCYFGTPTQATSENWGFAFSCKKDWLSKVKSDIQKLAECERKFAKAFFISNQFIRDKKRAEIENDLSKKHDLDVHILDRNWIINKIFDNKREDLAIEFLDIRVDKKQKSVPGANDSERQKNLDEVLKRLGDTSSYQGSDYAIAKDYMWAAKLSRGLEKPRHETEGLFKRAFDLAKKHQIKSLMIQVGYDYAWTSIWWFDDWEQLKEIYNEIEPCLAGTYNSDECELFMNLLNILYSGKASGYLEIDQEELTQKTEYVKAELNRLANDSERPNNAAHANTVLYLIELTEAMRAGDEDRIKQVFKALKKCLKESNGLGTYPLKGFIYSLSEMGEFIGNLPGYDELFKEMRRIGSKRLGEIDEGEMLYKRGLQLLESGKERSALQNFGEASIKLSKDESRDICIRAFLCCSETYTRMGLYWAARMEALWAAHMTLSTIEKMDQYPKVSVLAARKMCYLELSLGRIFPFLSWYELGRTTLNYLKSNGYSFEKIEDDFFQMDALLSCMLAVMNVEDVKKLHPIKPSLEAMELFVSSSMLSYICGDTAQALEEIPDEMAKNEDDLKSFLEQCKNQPASKDFKDHMQDQTSEHLEYEIVVMNVKFHFKVKNEEGLIFFFENLIGVLEAAFALSRWENHAFVIEKITIKIDSDESGQNPPEVNVKIEQEEDTIELICKPDILDWMNNLNSKELVDCFKLVLFRILINFSIDPIDEIENELDQWYKEGTFDRALSRSPLKIALTDLLGANRYGIDYWITKASPAQEV